MNIVLFPWGSKNMHFRQCIIFQISWFTYVFANIRRVPKWVQFAGRSLELAIQYFHLIF